MVVRTDAHVGAIEVEGGRASGVRLDDGETLHADAVVMTGDAEALSAGLLGEGARGAVGPAQSRSLSALTWGLAADVSGFALQHHNVFFGSAYRAEFDAIFTRGMLPRDPTVYLCAQDRGATDAAPDATERLLLLVNAPPNGDARPPNEGKSPHVRARC